MQNKLWWVGGSSASNKVHIIETNIFISKYGGIKFHVITI